ncbi:MAG: hypothetical protein KGJ86_11600 [Chloroflexota bacterium]|nr:hypothetical protein [Chloroflexota bacterium]
MNGAWQERAVAAWRQNAIVKRLRELLEVEIDPNSVQLTKQGTQATVEDVTFLLGADDGTLSVVAACPRCQKPQAAVVVVTITDLGRAIDSLCRDCDFLVRSGMGQRTPAPAGR